MGRRVVAVRSLPSRHKTEAGGQTRPILTAVVLIACALRAYHLGFQSLWRDEVDAVIFATRDLSTILATFSQIGENGPLYFLGLHFWIAIAGQGEFAIRFPSLVFGVLAVLLTYRLGCDIAGRRVALLAAALMSVSPYHIWYSQEAKMYAVISFLAPLSLVLLTRALKSSQRRLWAAYAVVMVVFLYIHLFAAMMLLVGAFWTLLLLRGRLRPSRSAFVALLAIGLALLPIARWLLPAALTRVATGYYPYSLGEMAAILLYNFSAGLRAPAGLWPVALFAVLLLLGALPLVHRRPGPTWPTAQTTLLLLSYMLLPLLAIWLVSLRRPTFTDRYLIISLPAFHLLLAMGIVVAGDVAGALVQWSSTQTQRLRLVIVFILAVAAAIGGAPFVWAQSQQVFKADFRGATRYVVERASAGEPIIFLMPYVQRSFAYYHAQPVPAMEPPYTRGMAPAQVDALLKSSLEGKQRVWLFLSEPEFWDPEGLISAWFEGNARLSCQQGFAYIEVRCYDLIRR